MVVSYMESNVFGGRGGYKMAAVWREDGLKHMPLQTCTATVVSFFSAQACTLHYLAVCAYVCAVVTFQIGFN